MTEVGVGRALSKSDLPIRDTPDLAEKKDRDNKPASEVPGSGVMFNRLLGGPQGRLRGAGMRFHCPPMQIGRSVKLTYGRTPTETSSSCSRTCVAELSPGPQGISSSRGAVRQTGPMNSHTPTHHGYRSPPGDHQPRRVLSPPLRTELPRYRRSPGRVGARSPTKPSASGVPPTLPGKAGACQGIAGRVAPVGASSFHTPLGLPETIPRGQSASTWGHRGKRTRVGARRRRWTITVISVYIL